MPEVNNSFVHAGFAPGGMGDLNGDGYPDILMPFYWYQHPGENLKNPRIKNLWPCKIVEDTPYGRSLRSFMIDLDEMTI